MNYPEIYRSKVYEGFKEIEPDAWREMIYFFEENEKRIKKLEFEEYFEVLIAYINALFDGEKFLKHLEIVDIAIEASVNRNIKYHNNQDIFKTLLYQKAVASYRTLQYPRADHILRELIRMDKADENSKELLEKTLSAVHPKFLQKTRAVSILFFLFSAMVICAEVVFIRTLMPEFLDTVEIIRNSLFFTGWAVLASGEIKHRLQVKKEIKDFIQSVG